MRVFEELIGMGMDETSLIPATAKPSRQRLLREELMCHL